MTSRLHTSIVLSKRSTTAYAEAMKAMTDGRSDPDVDRLLFDPPNDNVGDPDHAIPM